jgi:hypothetical protein
LSITFLYKTLPSKAIVEIVKGDTWSELLFSGMDIDANGNEYPAQLTGRTYRMQVRLDPYAPGFIMNLTPDKFVLGQSLEAIQYDIDQGNPAGTTKDQLFVHALSTDTDILAGKWYFDLEETGPGPDVKTIISGSFLVKQDVTRGGA